MDDVVHRVHGDVVADVFRRAIRGVAMLDVIERRHNKLLGRAQFMGS